VGNTIIAYVDESGDTGNTPGRSSRTYTLGCVMVNASDWNGSFDDLVAMRRRLKSSFGIPVRAEMKANYLIRNSGPFTKLNIAPGQRSLIYRAHLNQMAQDARLSAFGVVVHKSMTVQPSDVLDEAWTVLLQRLERTSNNQGGCPVMILHDEGENSRIRKLARWSRRRLSAGSITGSGSRRLPFSTLIDDPVPKASHESYFLQLADLVAYSAFRRLYAPSPAVSNVVDLKMWDNLGRAIFAPANARKTITAPGIVEVWK
jgi:hypothetical protein